jgi:hypothetical protein
MQQQQHQKEQQQLRSQQHQHQKEQQLRLQQEQHQKERQHLRLQLEQHQKEKQQLRLQLEQDQPEQRQLRLQLEQHQQEEQQLRLQLEQQSNEPTESGDPAREEYLRHLDAVMHDAASHEADQSGRLGNLVQIRDAIDSRFTTEGRDLADRYQTAEGRLLFHRRELELWQPGQLQHQRAQHNISILEPQLAQISAEQRVHQAVAHAELAEANREVQIAETAWRVAESLLDTINRARG